MGDVAALTEKEIDDREDYGEDRFIITGRANGRLLTVTYTEPGTRGDTASGNVTKPAKLETGIEIRVPLFIKNGETIKVSTETREFAGRA